MKIRLLPLLVGLTSAALLYGQETIHIAPDYTGGSSDGSIEHPYVHWKEVLPLQAGNTYLQKRDTTCDTDTIMTLASDVTIGAYGEGSKRPVINFNRSLSGNYGLFYIKKSGSDPAETVDNISISDLILHGNHISAVLLFEGNVTDVLVDNCKLTGGVWGIRILMTGPTGRANVLDNYARVLNCDISGCGEDGIYVDYTWAKLEIGYTSIYDVNRKYFGEYGGSAESQYTAPGDPIQVMSGFYSPWIHHCFLDKSNTEYKFALIIQTGQADGVFPQALVEYNIMVGQGRNSAATVYLDYGTDVVMRGNVFSNGPQAIYRSQGPGALTVYDNLFYDVNRAVTLEASMGIEFHNNTMIDCGGVFVPRVTDPIKLYNNLVFRVFGTSADYLFRSDDGSHPGTAQFESDYNLFSAEYGSMMFFGQGYNDLASWQGIGRDANSFVADPMFVDKASRDYRLAQNSPARNAGRVVDGITPTGDANPDIGAPTDVLYATGVGPQGTLPLIAAVQPVEKYGPYDVIDSQWFDSGQFLGVCDSVPTAPWLYCWTLKNWIWLPESHLLADGAWVYVQ